MSAPNLADLAGVLPSIQSFVNTVIANIVAKSPDVVKADEEVIRQAISDALEGVNVADLTSSIEAVLKVLKEGRGISGGGLDANLA